MAKTPKVFVSHTSADKDRFVIPFSEKLRANGVDAWLDKWEMLPGDSLVNKIFDEGLKEASAVIVVLSNHSVESAWVKEELNAAFIKRINENSKLIPVVIDECDIPNVLNSTLWERIKDINNYDESFDRILSSIFNQNNKPPIGSPPAHVQPDNIIQIRGLNNTDNLVLKTSCESLLNNGKDLFSFLSPQELFSINGEQPIPDGELYESLEILSERGYIKPLHVMGGMYAGYQVKNYGFGLYAQTYITNYRQIFNEIIYFIVNQNAKSSLEIHEQINQSPVLIDHVLEELDEKGLIKTQKALGGVYIIINISSELKRSLR